MKNRALSTVLILTACVFSLTVSAAPRDVQDLMGKKAKHADPQLQSRGYVHIQSQKGGSHLTYGMWWSPSKRECLTVKYQHGKITAITNSPPVDCNQQGHHASHDDNKAAAAAAVIGVAALAGAIAMSHKSHHHDDDRHNSNDSYEVDFERGHRDGLHSRTYDNHNQTDAYRNGYQSGVDQRDHDTSYREHSGRYDHGYRQQAEISDLNGARASSADGALRDRGFRDVDALKTGNTAYTYWYSRATGQCLQMTVADGRVEDIRDIGSHPNCR